MDQPTQIFEVHRRLLEGVAYRMLGSLTDAKDVVQDTYLRWSRAEFAAIRNPRSWLVTVCSRIAIDLMKSARIRRESYYGTWFFAEIEGSYDLGFWSMLVKDAGFSEVSTIANTVTLQLNLPGTSRCFVRLKFKSTLE